MHRQRQSLDPAQVAGDDFGAGLVQKKPRAVKKLHQRAGARKAAFGEQDEATAALEVFGDPFQAVGRRVVDQKCAAIDGDLAMQPVGVRRHPRDDEFPVLLQTDAEKEPIDQRLVVGNEQHRTRRLEHGLVVRAEPEKQSRQQPK